MNRSGPVVLLYAPPSDPTQSYTSLPTLTAFLRSKGESVIQRDLGIELLDSICSRAYLADAWATAQRLRADDVPPSARASFVARRTRLASVAPSLLASIERATRVMRDPAVFYDLATYRWAVTVMSDACDLASLPAHPTQLRPAGLECEVDCSLPGLLEATRPGRANFFAPHFDRLIPSILDSGPAVVGISATYHFQLIPALTLARRLKATAPTLPVVIGGAIVSRMEAHLLTQPGWFEMADYFVVGEGETALLAIVESVRTGSPIPRAPNVIQRRRGLPVAFDTSHVEDFRELPAPDFDGLDLARYFSPEPVLLMPTTRGCYYGKCTFCDVSRQTRTVYRPADRSRVCANILDLHRRHGARRFFFCDDAVPMNIMAEVAKFVSTELPDVTWQAEARLEKTMTPEFLTRIRQGGCRQLMFGFESSSQRVLDLMAKNNRVETDQAVLKACADAGIAVNLQTFIGLPGETRDEAAGTIQYLIDHEEDIASFGFGVFSLYKETPIYNEPEKHQVSNISIPLANNVLTSCDFEPLSGMSRAEANELHDQALEVLSPIYATRGTQLGGASGAHSLLQLSRYSFRELYRQCAAADDVVAPEELLTSRLAIDEATRLSRLDDGDGATSWAFNEARFCSVLLSEKDRRLLDGFAAPTSAEDVVEAVVGGDADDLASRARAYAVVKKLLDARILRPAPDEAAHGGAAARAPAEAKA